MLLKNYLCRTLERLTLTILTQSKKPISLQIHFFHDQILETHYSVKNDSFQIFMAERAVSMQNIAASLDQGEKRE